MLELLYAEKIDCTEHRAGGTIIERLCSTIPGAFRPPLRSVDSGMEGVSRARYALPCSGLGHLGL